jgi:protein TonB
MEKKKSKVANQEKNKSIYVLIGLSLSMAFALEWLEWEDNNIQQHLLKSSMLSFIGDEPVLEFKSQPVAIPPKPKPVVSEPVVVEDDALLVIEKPVKKQEIPFQTITVNKNLFNDFPDETLIIEKLPLDYAQKMPSFPGGNPALLKYLRDNTNYPEISRNRGSQEKIYVSFVVEINGSITNVQVVTGKDVHLKKESIRVIKSMPKWNPGKNMDRKVRVRQILPIKFVLLN